MFTRSSARSAIGNPAMFARGGAYVQEGRLSQVRGFPTGLSHVHSWWESILGLNVKAVQGKPVPLEWTDTSGGLLVWWHDPGVPLAFPVESASS